ncbi:helix-turn-helix domain-containing protein [Streptomyces sp. TBY4]|uniref:helix-turn-helix domain-containing protein n=1 Tax=Streptomyces sp. TBY4 TaxID=2962030 RepID=UPI0020B854D6|nr:helix-turn-helix domain-containing protein [Streptomyces sp. TBY4]MCP3756023.1 helix-turn-helix domain-containing protein [Streptomyces sp. TBY4]
MSKNPDPLLSITEAADYLGTGERMVRRLRAQRAVPVVKVGKHVRFRVSDLEAYLTAQTVPARGGLG